MSPEAHQFLGPDLRVNAVVPTEYFTPRKVRFELGKFAIFHSIKYKFLTKTGDQQYQGPLLGHQ